MVGSDSNNLNWLQEWYHSQCNEEWEHCYGIMIQTLDNPGWSVKIDLRDTTLTGAKMESIREDHGDNDWVFCSIENETFLGAGDPAKLDFILARFRDLIDQAGIVTETE